MLPAKSSMPGFLTPETATAAYFFIAGPVLTSPVLMDPLLPGLVSAPDKYLWSVEAEPGEMLLRQTIRRMMRQSGRISPGLNNLHGQLTKI